MSKTPITAELVQQISSLAGLELDLEQATKLELVINLKAAKTLGLTVPSEILVRANKVIE